MQAIQHRANTSRAVSEPQQFPPLDQVNRPYVPTSHAAYYLAYSEQTMREHHMRGTFDPRLRPIKRGNRLLWNLAGIKSVMGVSA